MCLAATKGDTVPMTSVCVAVVAEAATGAVAAAVVGVGVGIGKLTVGQTSGWSRERVLLGSFHNSLSKCTMHTLILDSLVGGRSNKSSL